MVGELSLTAVSELHYCLVVTHWLVWLNKWVVNKRETWLSKHRMWVGCCVGVIGVETQTVMLNIPADPGMPESTERTIPQVSSCFVLLPQSCEVSLHCTSLPGLCWPIGPQNNTTRLYRFLRPAAALSKHHSPSPVYPARRQLAESARAQLGTLSTTDQMENPCEAVERWPTSDRGIVCMRHTTAVQSVCPWRSSKHIGGPLCVATLVHHNSVWVLELLKADLKLVSCAAGWAGMVPRFSPEDSSSHRGV